MWKTRLHQQTTAPHQHEVILSRDDVSVVISLNDWWNMTATQHLADKALKENNLGFRMSELYGPPKPETPVWTTDLISNGDSHDVKLLRNGVSVVELSLQEFASLSATEFAVRDAVEVAGGLAVYGRNAKEVDEHFEAEFGDDQEDEDDDAPVRGPWESPRKR